MITPKWKTLEDYEEYTKQRYRFDKWCEEKGYFGHSKYFEAWLAALGYNEEDVNE